MEEHNGGGKQTTSFNEFLNRGRHSASGKWGGGKHLELHQPVCVGHQFNAGVVFGCYSTPMLLLHALRGINSGWPFLAGFDTTFGITSKKFELMGISINSLRRKANPLCLCIVKKEEAIAYETVYDSTEGGVFELIHNMKLFRQSLKCGMCDAVWEQIEQGPMQDLLTPPKPKKNKQLRSRGRVERCEERGMRHCLVDLELVCAVSGPLIASLSE